MTFIILAYLFSIVASSYFMYKLSVALDDFPPLHLAIFLVFMPIINTVAFIAFIFILLGQKVDFSSETILRKIYERKHNVDK